jgi:hypothetical protein
MTNLDAVDNVGVGVRVHMDPPFSGSGEVRAAAIRTQLWIFRFFPYCTLCNETGRAVLRQCGSAWLKPYNTSECLTS